MTSGTTDYRLSQLQMLEAESVHIFHEVAAELERPVLLGSSVSRKGTASAAPTFRVWRSPHLPFP